MGQSFVEYTLLISLILASCALALVALDISARDMYCAIAGGFGVDASCRHSFYDDFSDLDAWDVAQGNWRIDKGQLCGGPGEGRTFKDLSADDYVISINSATLGQGNGYGVFFRATNTPRFNGYSFQYDPGYRGGAFIIRKWIKGREIWPPFAVARARGYDWWQTPRQIRLSVKGNTFAVDVDGQQVLRATDDTYAQGGIGLRTWDRTTVCFDDLSVDTIP